MIKSVVIKGEDLDARSNRTNWHWSPKSTTYSVHLNQMVDEGEIHYVQVRFTDGTFVNLSEEELKNAAKLAKEGLGVTLNDEYLKRLSN